MLMDIIIQYIPRRGDITKERGLWGTFCEFDVTLKVLSFEKSSNKFGYLLSYLYLCSLY